MNTIYRHGVDVETVLVLLMLGAGAAVAAASIPTPLPPQGPGPADASPVEIVRAGGDCMEPLWWVGHLCVTNPILEYAAKTHLAVEVPQ